MYGNARWFFWFAAVVLLLLATLVAGTIITMTNSAWLLPGGLLALALSFGCGWGWNNGNGPNGP